eukprot:Rmarinus@m.23534
MKKILIVVCAVAIMVMVPAIVFMGHDTSTRTSEIPAIVPSVQTQAPVQQKAATTAPPPSPAPPSPIPPTSAGVSGEANAAFQPAHVEELHSDINRMFIVAAGHTGTSALSNLLHLLGVDHGPAEAKKNSFWERDDLVSINDKLLNPNKLTWASESVSAFNPRSNQLAEFGTEASRLLMKMDENCLDNEGHPKCSWVLKDPRLSLSFRFWRCLVEDQDPVVLYIIRHPTGVSMGKWLNGGYWRIRQLGTIASTWGLKRVVVDHSDLLADPVEFGRSLYSSLNSIDVKFIAEPSKEEYEALRKPSNRAGKIQKEIDSKGDDSGGDKDAIALYHLIKENIDVLNDSDDSRFRSLLSPDDLRIFDIFRPRPTDCMFSH